jgi:parallel beta-helix repeat protein
MRRLSISALSGSVLLLVMLFTLSTAEALDLYVDPAGICGNLAPCYRSLKKAIQAASMTGGDHINLFVATYSGAIVIDRPLVLRKSPFGNPGPGLPSINSSPAAKGEGYATILITAGPTVIEGLTIRATNKIRKSPGSTAIAIDVVNEVTIANNVVITEGTGDNHGIDVSSSKNVTITGNQVTVRGSTGVLLAFTENAVVTGNTIRAGGRGVYGYQNTHDSIIANQVDVAIIERSTKSNRIIGNIARAIGDESPNCRNVWLGNTFEFAGSQYDCPLD